MKFDYIEVNEKGVTLYFDDMPLYDLYELQKYIDRTLERRLKWAEWHNKLARGDESVYEGPKNG